MRNNHYFLSKLYKVLKLFGLLVSKLTWNCFVWQIIWRITFEDCFIDEYSIQFNESNVLFLFVYFNECVWS